MKELAGGIKSLSGPCTKLWGNFFVGGTLKVSITEQPKTEIIKKWLVLPALSEIYSKLKMHICQFLIDAVLFIADLMIYDHSEINRFRHVTCVLGLW